MRRSPSFLVLPGAQQPTRRYGEVCVLIDPDEALVWLHGDIDAAVQDELDGAVTDLTQAKLPVRVDASKMTFCDSAAVHFLAHLLRAGLSVRVEDPSGRLAWLLELVLAPDTVLERLQTALAGTRRTGSPGTPILLRSTSSGTSPTATPASASPAAPEVAAFAARVVQLRRARRRAQRMRAARHRH